MFVFVSDKILVYVGNNYESNIVCGTGSIKGKHICRIMYLAVMLQPRVISRVLCVSESVEENVRQEQNHTEDCQDKGHKSSSLCFRCHMRFVTDKQTRIR